MIRLLKSVKDKKELSIKLSNAECRYIKKQIITKESGKKIYVNTSMILLVFSTFVVIFTSVMYAFCKEITDTIRLLYEVFIISFLISLTMYSLSLVHERKVENRNLVLTFIEKAKPLCIENTLDDDLSEYLYYLLRGFPNDKDKPF